MKRLFSDKFTKFEITYLFNDIFCSIIKFYDL